MLVSEGAAAKEIVAIDLVEWVVVLYTRGIEGGAPELVYPNISGTVMEEEHLTLQQRVGCFGTELDSLGGCAVVLRAVGDKGVGGGASVIGRRAWTSVQRG